MTHGDDRSRKRERAPGYPPESQGWRMTPARRLRDQQAMSPRLPLALIAAWSTGATIALIWRLATFLSGS